MARDNNERDDLNINHGNESEGVDRGFGGMNSQKRKDTASRGGKAAHEKGTAHEWDSNEAKDAGRKGGSASTSGGIGEETKPEDEINQNR